MVRRITRLHLWGKPCYIRIERARNKNHEIAARDLQIPPMVYDGARPMARSSTTRTIGILLPRVCTMKDPHKVVPIYGLAIGGL